MQIQKFKRRMYVYKNDFSSFFDESLDLIEINRKKENIKLTTNDFIKKALKTYGEELYDYSFVKYKNMSTKVKIKCLKHNIYYEVTPTNHLYNNIGCPNCNYEYGSKGELIIENYLNDNNILFEKQKSFDECKNIKKLRFDFYLPNYNLLIEFDGAQHYNVVNHWGGEDGLKYRMKCDMIKNEYVFNNNVQLLRITYNDLSNIPSILKNNLIFENEII